MIQTDTLSLAVQIALNNWASELKRADSLVNSLSDSDLNQEIAPGRNRGIYLLGHLTAVHDLMLPLLRLESALYPNLKAPFIDAPDKTIDALPTAAELRADWKAVNERLTEHFDRLMPEEWLERHNSVSEADFANEPHRNRLNVLQSRTAHLAYHRGQMALLKKKE